MKKILIVEDEEGMLDGLAHNFRYEGYDVLTAKNGQEGLRLALKQKPDAVLLDIMLPEKDGFTVLKELRQRHKDIPVLVMTARNFEADVLKGFDLGADDYVTKPFSIKEVMARVKRLVARGPMNTGAPRKTSRPIPALDRFVFLGSGFGAGRRPGMTPNLRCPPRRATPGISRFCGAIAG